MYNDHPTHPYAYELILTPGIPVDICSGIYLDPERHPDCLKTKQVSWEGVSGIKGRLPEPYSDGGYFGPSSEDIQKHYDNIKSWSKVIPIFKKSADFKTVHVCTYVIYSDKEFIDNNPELIQERAILTAVYNGYDVGDMEANDRPRFKHHDCLVNLDMSKMCFIFNNYYWKELTFKWCDFKEVTFQRWTWVKHDFGPCGKTTYWSDFNYSRFINCEFDSSKSDVINIFRQGCVLRDCFIRHEGRMYFVLSKDSLFFIEPPSEVVAYAIFIKTDKGVRVSIDGHSFANQLEFFKKFNNPGNYNKQTQKRECEIMAAAFDAAEQAFRAFDLYPRHPLTWDVEKDFAKKVWDLIKKKIKNTLLFKKNEELYMVQPRYKYIHTAPMLGIINLKELAPDFSTEVKTVLSDVATDIQNLNGLLEEIAPPVWESSITQVHEVHHLPEKGVIGDIYVTKTFAKDYYWRRDDPYGWTKVDPTYGLNNEVNQLRKQDAAHAAVLSKAFDAVTSFSNPLLYEYPLFPLMEFSVTDLSGIMKMPIPIQGGMPHHELHERIWQAIKFLEITDQAVIARSRKTAKVWLDVPKFLQWDYLRVSAQEFFDSLLAQGVHERYSLIFSADGKKYLLTEVQLVGIGSVENSLVHDVQPIEDKSLGAKLSINFTPLSSDIPDYKPRLKD